MKNDKYVEDKTEAIFSRLDDPILYVSKKKLWLKDFIRTIVGECQPKVSRELIKKYADRLNITKMMGFSQETMVSEIIDMFKEAGVEVEE